MKHDLMKKLMEKKAEKKLSPNEQKAKMSVMEELQNMASDAMGKKLDGIKKVTVASDDEQGLKKGLEKASEIVDKGIPALDSSDEEQDEMMEEEQEEMMGEQPEDEMSEDEINEKLEELMKKKEMLKRKV